MPERMVESPPPTCRKGHGDWRGIRLREKKTQVHPCYRGALSGGQRQRLSIARAFVRNAPILLLDEATASLDSQPEGEVQAAIDRFAENRTVVTIAHRLSTLMACDRIIGLDRGRIIAEGTFANLLQKGGAFAVMAQRQGMLSASDPA